MTTATTARNPIPLLALLAANAVSWLGNSFAMVALPWFVLETTGSASLTGLAGAATILPSFFSGLFGGVLVDRVGPVRIAILGEVISGAAVAAIPLLHAAGWLSFPLLFTLIVAGAVFDIPGLSARRTLLVSLSRDAGVQRERANAAFESLPNVAWLLGPPIAGLVVTTAGVSAALWIDAASFVISAALLVWALPSKGSALASRLPEFNLKTYLSDVREGIACIWQDPGVRLITLGFMLANVVSRPYFAVVLPTWARSTGESASWFGFMISASGAGAVAGGVLYGAIGRRVPRRCWWIGFAAMLPVEMVVLAVNAPAIIIAAVLAVGGLADGGMSAMSVTVRQERIPARIMGRAFSTSSAFTVLTAPVGMMLAGSLMSNYSTTTALKTLAGVSVIVGAGMIVNPLLHSLEVTRGSYPGS